MTEQDKERERQIAEVEEEIDWLGYQIVAQKNTIRRRIRDGLSVLDEVEVEGLEHNLLIIQRILTRLESIKAELQRGMTTPPTEAV